MTRLSILIPTRNRATWLELLLRQLAEDPDVAGGEVEIIVSDNASTDDTARLLAHLRAELSQLPLRIATQPENLGLVGNLQWLVESAEGEYVWLLGDDDRPEPGAVAEILAALGTLAPAVLHLPHRFEPLPGGPTTHQSPCPDALQTFPTSRELVLAYTHWLSFISAAVVRRAQLRRAIAATDNQNPWAPHVWFALAGRDAACAVLPRRVLIGAGEVSWRDTYQRYMTTCAVATYDAGLRTILTATEFAALLDERCRTGGALDAWDAAPLEELAAAVRRFPASRVLRKKLADRVHRRGRPDLLALVADAVRTTGDDQDAGDLVRAGEERFVRGDHIAAATAFDAALELDPAHAEAWSDLGVTRAAQGRFDAVFAFDRALELDPSHVGALLNRAAWALARGHRAQAALDVEAALVLEPDNAAAQALRAELPRPAAHA